MRTGTSRSADFPPPPSLLRLLPLLTGATEKGACGRVRNLACYGIGGGLVGSPFPVCRLIAFPTSRPCDTSSIVQRLPPRQTTLPCHIALSAASASLPSQPLRPFALFRYSSASPLLCLVASLFRYSFASLTPRFASPLSLRPFASPLPRTAAPLPPKLRAGNLTTD